MGTGKKGMSMMVLSLLSLVALCPSLLQASELRLVHYPEAIYSGEPATFVAAGDATNKVRALLDGTEIDAIALNEKRGEFNLKLTQPGLLRFETDGATVSFDVVTPDYKGALREADGYLFTERGPAILLTDHRHPPKHSRRWELLKAIKGLFVDTRPELASARFIGPAFASAGTSNTVRRTTGLAATNCTILSPPGTFYDIHALITDTRTAPASDITVVSLSARDLERGMPFLAYAQKLEWYLQALSTRKATYLHVIAPTFTKHQQNRFGTFLDRLRLSAHGNQARFLDPSTADSSHSDNERTVWLLNTILEKVRFNP
jgi:hypothetical protein